MKIAVIGRGSVGATLGGRFAAVGHEVVYGVRRPAQPDELAPADATAWAEVVLICVPGHAVVPELVEGWNAAGKVVVDATNPIAPTFDGLAPISEGSNAERLAHLLPDSHVLKAFNTFGVEVMADPTFPGGPATLLVAGDDAQAKNLVLSLGGQIGLEPMDAGPLTQARWLESLAWLWISMAIKFGASRNIAFRVLRR